jgi:hypothetical protein
MQEGGTAFRLAGCQLFVARGTHIVLWKVSGYLRVEVCRRWRSYGEEALTISQRLTLLKFQGVFLTFLNTGWEPIKKRGRIITYIFPSFSFSPVPVNPFSILSSISHFPLFSFPFYLSNQLMGESLLDKKNF